MIEVTVYGAEESRRRLAKFARAMSPQSRAIANEQAGIELHSDVIRTFEAEGATFGRPRWEDLKAEGRYPRTNSKDKTATNAKGKKRKFQTAYQILQDTHALRGSFIPLSDDDLAGVGAQSTREHADIAEAHQFGVPSRNLPARPMLPTEDCALEVVTKVYGLMIEEAARP